MMRESGKNSTTAPTSLARGLRGRATDAEQRLWHHLRNRGLAGVKLRRQQPVGHYIVDFFCAELKLIVELDGGQHASNVAEDLIRDNWLLANGYRVLRFWNQEVLTNLTGVRETIHAAVASAGTGNPRLAIDRPEADSRLPLTPALSLKGRGRKTTQNAE